MLNRLTDMLSRRWRERLLYPRKRDWFLSLYNRALRTPFLKWLPGHAGIAAIYLKDIPEPFYLRLGSTDWLVLEEIYLHAEYDFLSEINLGDVRQIVDLGANVGLSCRLWRKKFPQANILAVEPDPDNVIALERNRGDDPQTRVVQACVAATRRTVRIDRSLGAWGVKMTDGPGNQATVSVDALPLPNILADQHFFSDIDLLKCDIEGAEAEVFGDCASWINHVRALILEIHSPYTLSKWQEDMQAAHSQLKLIRTIKSGPDVTVILAALPALAQPSETPATSA